MADKKMLSELYEYDDAVRNELSGGFLCGVDEAGRGPLAGDVFAAAVIFDESVRIEGINDSKKLTEKKRDKLYDEIIEKATAYCIARASVEEIESINILEAAMLAMKRAVEGLGKTPSLVIADGNKAPVIENITTRAVIKGDAVSASIAAASILAKVARDRYMAQMALEYPEYKFEKHKGYGTKLHYQMLDENGPSDIHRMSFLRKYYDKKRSGE
ncbi:MAG: ribonuclease HII [Oscillospiraceae bacterium]|nr:ribonuclease HII [Oscillospiraceae bacterium]MBQ9981576.1 ribonuclease HII [Oscillospiraceae bacterium]